MDVGVPPRPAPNLVKANPHFIHQNGAPTIQAFVPLRVVQRSGALEVAFRCGLFTCQGRSSSRPRRTRSLENEPRDAGDALESSPAGPEGSSTTRSETGKGGSTPPSETGEGGSTPPSETGEGGSTPRFATGEGSPTPPSEDGEGGSTPSAEDGRAVRHRAPKTGERLDIELRTGEGPFRSEVRDGEAGPKGHEYG